MKSESPRIVRGGQSRHASQEQARRRDVGCGHCPSARLEKRGGQARHAAGEGGSGHTGERASKQGAMRRRLARESGHEAPDALGPRGRILVPKGAAEGVGGEHRGTQHVCAHASRLNLYLEASRGIHAEGAAQNCREGARLTARAREVDKGEGVIHVARPEHEAAVYKGAHRAILSHGRNALGACGAGEPAHGSAHHRAVALLSATPRLPRPSQPRPSEAAAVAAKIATVTATAGAATTRAPTHSSYAGSPITVLVQRRHSPCNSK